MTRVVAIIPARYESSRFPGKPLAEIDGRPMIAHVYERTGRARGISDVFVATDDDRIKDAVIEHGGYVIMTSPDCASGTDRIAEAIAEIKADIIVNVQGDEPLIAPSMIEAAITPLLENYQIEFGTLKRPIAEDEDPTNSNLVKVVCDRNDFALYFSRSPIPHLRGVDGDNRPAVGGCFVHVGLYVYRRESLLKFASAPQTALEQAERLEQLRILENGWRIIAPTTNIRSIGVDVPEDLEMVQKSLKENRL